MGDVAFDENGKVDCSGLFDYEGPVCSAYAGVRYLEDVYSIFFGEILHKFSVKETESSAVLHYGVFGGLAGKFKQCRKLKA